MIHLLAKHIATVNPSLFYKSGLCHHYFGGIIPLADNINATVFPLLSYISGSYSLSFDGIYPFYAYIIASVVLLSNGTILFVYHYYGTCIFFSIRNISTFLP